MRAVDLECERRVGVNDVPGPTLLDVRSAIVEVEQTSICGSDLHFYWGKFGDSCGIRPGHEFIGTVVAVGWSVHDRRGTVTLRARAALDVLDHRARRRAPTNEVQREQRL